MAPVERNRNTKPTGLSSHRLASTPYEREGNRASIVRRGEILEPTAPGAGERGETPAQAASRLSTISRSVVRAFGSLWNASSTSESQDPAPSRLPAKPLVLRKLAPAACDVLSTAATVGSSDRGSRLGSVSPDASVNEQLNPSLMWSETTAQPQFDLSVLQNQGNLSMPANMIIAAYRDALLANETSILKRRRQSPSPSPATPKSKTSSKDNNSVAGTRPAVPALPVASAEKTNGEVSQPAQKFAKVDIEGDVTKIPVAQTRIELVTRPIIDLTQLPEDRKKRPGFISVDFELSESEDEDEEPATEVPRRPLVESSEIVEARQAVKETKNPAVSEKPKFSFEEPESKKVEVKDAKPAFALESKPATAEEKPAFSFGASLAGKPAETPAEKPVENVKPPFSFGTQQSTGKETPAFSFGGKLPTKDDKAEPTKKLFSFDEKPPADKKPAFSFGSTEKKPDNGGSAFSFGEKPPASAEPVSASTQEKPAFSFGGKPAANDAPAPLSDAPAVAAEKPVFSFGSTPASAEPAKDSTPAFSFGTAENSSSGPKDKPAFSFGGPAQQKTGDSAQTAKPDKPVFTFGQSDSTLATDSTKQRGTENALDSAFSIGAPAKKRAADEPEAAKPAFNFGASKPADAPSSTTAFSFGQSDSKPAEKPAGSFAFGNNSGPAPGASGFTFGATNNGSQKPADGAAAAAATGKPETPASTPFSFGPSQPAADGTKSATSGLFGQAADKPAGFTFGAPAAAASSTPFSKPQDSSGGFNFGATGARAGTPAGGAGAGNSTPGFTFGAQSAPATGTSGSGGFTFGANSTGAGANMGSGGFTFGQSGSQSTQAAQPAQTPPAFGTNSNFAFSSKPAGSGFSFGSNTTNNNNGAPFNTQAPAAGQAAPAGGFTFGANSGGSGAPAFGSNPPGGSMGLGVGAFANNPLASGLASAPATRPDGRPLAQVRRRIPPRR